MKFTKKNWIITVLCLGLLAGGVWGLLFGPDLYINRATLEADKKDVQHADLSTLYRQSANTATYNALKKTPKKTFQLAADNQGSGNILYYPVDIDKQTFWITSKLVRKFPAKIVVQRIEKFKK